MAGINFSEMTHACLLLCTIQCALYGGRVCGLTALGPSLTSASTWICVHMDRAPGAVHGLVPKQGTHREKYLISSISIFSLVSFMEA